MSVTTLEAPLRRLHAAEDATPVAGCGATPMTTQCSACHLRDLCLPGGLSDEDLMRLDRLGFGRRRVKAGDVLYHEGQPFQSIYAVRSGTFKSSLMLSDGREQVCGFYMAGELLGLDGVAHGKHPSTAQALEDTEVCTLPYAQISQLATESSAQQHECRRAPGRVPAQPFATHGCARVFAA